MTGGTTKRQPIGMANVPAGEARATAAAENRLSAFASVLVGVDGSDSGRDAILLGAALCAADGGLTLAHSFNAANYLSVDPAVARSESRQMLERERAAADVAAELTTIDSLAVGRSLHDLAEDSSADLLVVGSSKRGVLGRVFIGDDTRAALNGASCAVAVAPHGYAKHPRAIKIIGVGYNDTPEAEAALAVARSLAARHGAAIRALTVVSPPSMGTGYWEPVLVGQTIIDNRNEVAEARLGSLDGVDGRVAFGVPGEELAAFGDELDLLVVGSRSFGPLRRMMLGSTSQHLARSGRCPLLVLPRAALGRHDGNVTQDESATDPVA